MASPYRTPAYVARMLCRAHRLVTGRTLLNLAKKGLLPRLAERGKGQGKGKIYYWKERDIVHRAYTVRELLWWSSRTEYVPFMLWLLGYNVDDQRWVRPRFIDMFAGVEELQEIHDLREDVDTGQAELSVDGYAYEELLDRLSQLAVELVARWRHDPRQRPNRSFLNDPRAAEIYLNVLRNPAYEPGI